MSNAAHESYADHAPVQGPTDRSFGLTVGGILTAIGLVRRYAFGASIESTTILTVTGLLLVVFGLVAPGWLAPLNHMWMKLGLLLSRIVNPVVMMLMFALVFVPMALVMRLAGRDALRLKRDPDAQSYWIVRQPPGPPPATMVNPF